jgi:uncharacterized protein (TIGR02231 family)
MKKITLLLLTFFVVVTLASAQQSIVVNADAQEVTVYLSGAEIKFKETVALKRGDNIVRFRGFSPSLIDNSVQITAGNTVEVLSVSAVAEQLPPEDISPRVKALKDSIAALENRIVLITNQLDAYEMEKQTLKQNQQIGGTQAGVSLMELAKAADFFRDRTLKINNALTALNKNHQVFNNRLLTKKSELDKELQKINQTRYAVDVTVNSKADQSVDFAIRYLAGDAGWEASYDIVAPEINKPVTLKYKAQVYNNTGVDWRDVKLSLSTGDISLDATRPFLTAWTLNYTSKENEGVLNRMAQNRTELKVDSTLTESETAVSELNTSFVIEQRHSIHADARPYRISLQTEILPASFEYLTVPKMELSAFLIAKVTGWEKLNLIDGTANIYYGNTYMGESNINTRQIGDTLELSLGRDNQIVVSRTKVEDKGSTSVIGTKRSESFTYEIHLRNNRRVPVLIKVQDQIPVAQEKDISVEVADLSGAHLDAPSGRLQWIKTLPAGENTKYRISFTVKYPKNQTVNIRKSRTVRTPRYMH